MDQQKWRDFYSDADIWSVWIKIMTDDGEHFFFSNHKEWKSVKDYCIKNSVFVKDFHLQLRSNEVIVDIHEETEALYFVRSVMGVLNGPTTEYFTIGQLRNGKMHKEMWLVPELIMDRETVETIDECFEEAILYNEEKKTNRQKQVQT